MTKRTTIEIDQDLLDRAKQALGETTTRATVEEALRRDDREGDVLDVYFGDNRPAWTIELTENITIGIDRQAETVLSLSFLDFSRLARPTASGPRSFPVTGLAELPDSERDLVLRLITSPPVSRWLDG